MSRRQTVAGLPLYSCRYDRVTACIPAVVSWSCASPLTEMLWFPGTSPCENGSIVFGVQYCKRIGDVVRPVSIYPITLTLSGTQQFHLELSATCFLSALDVSYSFVVGRLVPLVCSVGGAMVIRLVPLASVIQRVGGMTCWERCGHNAGYFLPFPTMLGCTLCLSRPPSHLTS